MMCAGIKAIKLHAWEAPFEKRINHLREVEMQQIRQACPATICWLCWHEAGKIRRCLLVVGGCFD